jgi:hypothetical protein
VDALGDWVQYNASAEADLAIASTSTPAALDDRHPEALRKRRMQIPPEPACYLLSEWDRRPSTAGRASEVTRGDDTIREEFD